MQSPTQLSMDSPISRKVSMTKSGSTPMTYIPPLIDGACGTVLRAEQPTASLLRDDVKAMARMIPNMFRSLWSELLCNGRKMSWADMCDALVHVNLTVMELAMMVGMIPLWLVLPGLAFAGWCAVCVMIIASFSKLVNGKNRVIRCAAGSDGWMMGQEAEDERWIYVGGMGLR